MNLENPAGRWGAFNGIGALGLLVQMMSLYALIGPLHAPYILAVACATEAAVLHNFVWHCRVTWAERVRSRHEMLTAFLRFHLANGAISVAGNVGLGVLFKDVLGMPALVASCVAVAACSLLNFFACHRWVFAPARSRDMISAQRYNSWSQPSHSHRSPSEASDGLSCPPIARPHRRRQW